ncbi:dienelactone hydrolase family protein [Kribbella qitaiheensis]|uniref:dienelactone hydrolase family protein n=1 Tax=Kribbella qitaiheensis TaxID=1544730 RepID=UPI003620173E
MADYLHLGVYSDWVEQAAAPRARAAVPAADEVREAVRRMVSSAGADGAPTDVRLERQWTAGGLHGEELSYSVGFGPRTRAWLLKPADATEPLPGVLALHGHDGFKYYGKEKIADGPEPPSAAVEALRADLYEGRAVANDLAAEGYVVLVPDVFTWGSRRFPLAEMPPSIHGLSAGQVDEPATYNPAARRHEHLVEKYCTVLGTTMAAVVAREDRIALAYLRGRSDTNDQTACIGLSGGGCRSALLRATSEELTAAVVVGMMSTYDGLLDHNVVDHTWMFLPRMLPAQVDWPDLAACQSPAPLLVQYNRHDQLFTLEGATAAHERIGAHYAGAEAAYTGQFFDGPHKLDREMQFAAFTWLRDALSGCSRPAG